jgi:hypothetical protein
VECSTLRQTPTHHSQVILSTRQAPWDVVFRKTCRLLIKQQQILTTLRSLSNSRTRNFLNRLSRNRKSTTKTCNRDTLTSRHRKSTTVRSTKTLFTALFVGIPQHGSICSKYPLEVKRVILAEKNYNWKLYNEVPEEYKIEFVAISKRMKFKDDVIVVVEADPKGGSIVHARSKSRIGIGDMNVNHDRLVYLLNQLFKDENAKEPQKEKPKDADNSNPTS